MAACVQMMKIRHGEFTYTVPCGKCGFCLQNKRSSWMFRVFHEMRSQEYPGWFITLTYSERYVKRVPGVGLSLRFRDVQLFLKKLRRAKFYAKYICVGEYGGETKRPHYHLLLWSDCPPQSFEKYWSVIDKKNGVQRLGQVHIGRITMESAMYTLKYILQPKQRAENGLEKTRAQFSKGIGLAYLTAAVYDYHTFDYESPRFTSVVDGRKVALPRYYKQKIFTKYQLAKESHRVKWESIRERRKEMRALLAQGVSNTKIYIDSVRSEQARRIIKSTKYNQTI